MAITVQEFRTILGYYPDVPVLFKITKRPGYQSLSGITQLAITRTSIWAGNSTPQSIMALKMTARLTKNANSITPVESGEFPTLTDVKTTTEILTLLPDTYNSFTLGVDLTGYFGEIKNPYNYGALTESTGKQALVFWFMI